MKLLRYVTMVLLGSGVSMPGQTDEAAFFNWETAPVHPMALSPGATRLVVCNLPDNRLEVFDVSAGSPALVGSIPVGLDPVSVRFRTEDEAWVANYISDSISIVSMREMRVVATVATLDEPSDIVFAGTPQRAFVSCAQAGVVQVFDPAARVAETGIVIAGNRPKAMGVSSGGDKVYVAILESGNASTVIGARLSLNLPPPTPIDFPSGPHGGANPPPNRGASFFPALNPALPAGVMPPRTSLIVKRNAAGRWMDDNEGDWTDYISGGNAVHSGRTPGWDMPDHDLAVIDANDYSVRHASGLMNICMSVGVNPASGKIAVAGTEAMNHIRFEPLLKGVFGRVHLAMVDPLDLTGAIVDLNPHLDYQAASIPMEERRQSIGDPRGIVWRGDGTRGYVAGMGSDNVVVIGPDGGRIGGMAPIPVGEGPTGMALDEGRNRLYVWNRFSATISVVDTEAGEVVEAVRLFDPTPASIQAGRRLLYNTHRTSGLGHLACASCHVDARFDRLAWDLGDPSGAMVFLTNANFGRFPPAVTNDFHPMKGPMTTQTLQGIIGLEPFHWRGDRAGLEEFDATFTDLQGADEMPSEEEMREIKAFLATIRFPPNPFRRLDNTLSTNLPLPGHAALGRGGLKAGERLPDGNAQAGMLRFRLEGPDGCIHCHTLPSGVGPDARWTGSQWIPLPVGPRGEHHAAFTAIDRSSGRPFKTPHLRNLHEKGAFDMTASSQSGFGFLHDGSVDSLVRFIQDGFSFRDDQETADMIAFLLSFSGSDLPAGSPFEADRPPGLPSNDTHAAVGRQTTVDRPGPAPLVEEMIALAAPSTTRVELVAKGAKDGIARGWHFDRETGVFQSDRKGEVFSAEELLQLAASGSELTFTVVPLGSGVRIGVDRDGDGHFDRDEIDARQFRAVILEGGVVRLSWPGASASRYRIEYTEELDKPLWVELDSGVVAGEGVLAASDAISETQRFYRLVLLE